MGKSRRQAMTALAIFLLACCPCSFALDPSLDVSQYAHTVWKIRDGFAAGMITSLAQTPDGYLWLGTESGLLHFDGVRPDLWQPPLGQQLPGTQVSNLLAARDGTLWIGTVTGLATWKGDQLKKVPELADQFITFLLETRDGTVWIGTYAGPGGKLCNAQKGLVHCEALQTGIEALYEDRRGTLWVGMQNGIWRWKPRAARFFPIAEDNFGVTSFAEDEQGQLLFGSYAGIRRVLDDGIAPYPSSAPCYGWPVEGLFRDREGNLWVGTSEHGIVHIHGNGKIDVFSHLDGLSGDYTRRFLLDREGSVWVATRDGIDRFRAYAIPTISTKQGLSSATPWSVLASKDGSVWIAGNSALDHWSKGQVSVFRNGAARQKSDGKVHQSPPVCLFQDSSGRIWVSNASGEVGYVQDERWFPVAGLSGGVIFSMAEVQPGRLWIANKEAGLFQLFEGRVVQHISWAGLGHQDYAKVLVADPSRHGLWLGFSRSGIAYFSDGGIRETYAESNGLGKGMITDLRFGTRGTLWAATANGLSRIKNGRVATLTRRNGLPCDEVVATAEDDDHSMWINLACGLVRVTQTELDAWVADSNRVITAEVFDAYDGVRNHAAAGGFQPLMTKSTDGKIWFLPWDGVSVIDPYHLAFNKIPPPVHIEKITADDKSAEISNGMHLPTGVRHLDIDYTALSLVVPEKVHFRVKLEGEDKDWRELVNVRHVEYTNLPPNHYRFRVLACNNSGVWNEEGAALDFVIPPAWYQTNWFRAICIAAFLAMIWGIYELRVRQLAAQFNMRLEERVSERSRIARDLHDTLLQSFQGLVFRFQAARYHLPDRPEEASDALDSALVSADQAIAEGRSAIQELRSRPFNENELEQMLLAMGGELTSSQKDGGSPPSLRVIVEGKRRPKRPIIGEEVYRIARELLRNAYKHAHARSIEAELRYDDDAFLLVVRDDGKGIDSKVLQERGRAGHWGLPGMYERAAGIGARLDIWSEVGAGTEVRLAIPANIAYEKSGDGGRFKLFRKTRTYEHRS